jgi:hypothetical protein
MIVCAIASRENLNRPLARGVKRKECQADALDPALSNPTSERIFRIKMPATPLRIHPFRDLDFAMPGDLQPQKLEWEVQAQRDVFGQLILTSIQALVILLYLRQAQLKSLSFQPLGHG